MLKKHEATILKNNLKRIEELEKQMDAAIRLAITMSLKEASCTHDNGVAMEELQRRYREAGYATKLLMSERDRAYSPEQRWTLTIMLEDI
jgi:hypothetical protein